METTTTMRCPPHPLGCLLSKTPKAASAGEDVRGQSPGALVVGTKNGRATGENLGRVLKKFKKECAL